MEEHKYRDKVSISGVINYRASNVVDFCNFYNTFTSF